MSNKNRSLSILMLAIGLTYCGACGSQAPPLQPSAANTPPKADVYTLDVVIFSPISIVQHKNGEIDLLMPNVDQHPYGSIKGMNDCGMDEGKGQDYRLDFSNTALPTSVDPQNTMPNEVKVDSNVETVRVDPFGARYGKVSLPAPREILPIHLDDEGLSIYTPGGLKPKGHLYPTQIALRYTVPVNTQVSLTNTISSVKVCSPQAAQLDKEMILSIGMGPGIDDDHHTHAIKAFHAERDLFPPLSRDIYYPERNPTSEDKKERRHRTSDCQAPIVLVLNADVTGKTVPAKK
jgi:hypothetical protein